MYKRIKEILSFFRIDKLRNDKRVVIFLICFLIATVLWFLNALEKDYTTTISYPIKYTNLPEKQFISNEPPKNFELQVQAHGFTLLRHKLSFSFSPIVLNIKNIINNQESINGSYRVVTNLIRRRIAEQISNEIEITNIRPEIINIVLDSLKTRQIPVRAKVNFDFKPQFKLSAPVEIIPEKVSVTGPAQIVDNITSIETIQKEYTKLDATTTKTLSLVKPENISVKPKQVDVKIHVEKFTEKRLKVPIKVVNNPDTLKIKLFPAELDLLVLVGLSKFESISASDFNVEVDFNEIEPNTENLKIRIEKIPEFVEVLRYSPDFVEFLIVTD